MARRKEALTETPVPMQQGQKNNQTGRGRLLKLLKLLCCLSCSLPRRSVRCRFRNSNWEALRNPATIIQIQPDNPKNLAAKPSRDLIVTRQLPPSEMQQTKVPIGKIWPRISKEFLKIPDLIPSDVDGQGGTKRGAPAGTPDREADARSKMHSSATMVPKVLIPEANDPISKVEMSAATITALSAMMREESKNGMLEMEDRFSNKLHQAVGNVKEEVKIEREARQQLEERIARLEKESALKEDKFSQNGNHEAEDVDKAVAVVGGFVDKTLEEVETLVEGMMRGVQGYKDMEIVDINPPLALATFDAPMQAMKLEKESNVAN